MQQHRPGGEAADGVADCRRCGVSSALFRACVASLRRGTRVESALTPNEAEGALTPKSNWLSATAIVASCEWKLLTSSEISSPATGERTRDYLVRYAYSANSTQ